MMTATPYEALVESAARLTDTDALAEINEDDVSLASELINRNRIALETARSALGPQCVVPLRYDESFFSEHCDHFSHLRNLARVFRVEALLAASDKNYEDVARIGIDILELANAVRRGGLITDLLVGIAISGIAMNNLRKIRTRLDDTTSLSLIQDMQRIESEREPFSDIAARDRAWEMAVGCADAPCDFKSLELSDPKECGLSIEEQKTLHDALQQIADLPKPAHRKMQLDQDHRSLASMRMLVVDLALRQFRNSSGTLPSDLKSLTPQPLPSLPLDPYTNESFIYRRFDDASFHLYSTGPKMRDGGGQFGPWHSVAAGYADLCLDTDDYSSHCGMVLQPHGFAHRVASTIRTWWRARRT